MCQGLLRVRWLLATSASASALQALAPRVQRRNAACEAVR